ncbi:precorrin-3B C(17)-methyltransferase [Lachnobacterium bovis]|uniref:precorrin-3B C(17)-methyltransferase n=1 Tax=Lachnobacterium bovis TaxID=140626 RepID=UPI000485E848|nr:precorrin-3B C(17)-methyltransferase [Lachnobacterium bovis]
MTNCIYIVGMGPGKGTKMTIEARAILREMDTIIGYQVYLDLLGEEYSDKELISTPMKKEVERCRICYEKALEGKKVAMICSGDAGIYGMASLMYELLQEYSNPNKKIKLRVVPGITAAISGAAEIGAPLNHDFCVISLSDLLTPWEKIEKRLKAAAYADFAIALYNPSSKKRSHYLEKACIIMSEYIENTRPCGYVKNIGREGTEIKVCSFEELKNEKVDMFTTVFIGNSCTKIIDNKLITPRGYKKNE